MQTARFWHYHTGAVLIKLRPGQSVTHTSGGLTDEGSHWAINTYSFDGATVTCEWATDGRDCDGRHSASGKSFCPVSQLKAGYRDDDGITFPEWQHGESRQRDYSAEAAGY